MYLNARYIFDKQIIQIQYDLPHPSRLKTSISWYSIGSLPGQKFLLEFLHSSSHSSIRTKNVLLSANAPLFVCSFSCVNIEIALEIK